MFRNYFKEFFTFNKSERNGILFLLLIIILFILFPLVYPLFLSSSQKIDIKAFERDIAQFERDLKIIENQTPKKNIDYLHNQSDKAFAEIKLTPFYFNPNKLPVEKWKQLGLKDNQIKTILNFESKGGKFRTKDDFKKMYCITSEEYNTLEPYILITNTLDSTKINLEFKNKFSQKTNEIFEINAADTSDLIKIKGIGPGYARRIVKYRKKLGGFYKKEQLLEVWGLDTIMYQTISKQIEVNPYRITRISINTASLAELSAHPYMDKFVAQALINYRNLHGRFQKLEDIKKSAMITDDLYKKIYYYLDVN